LEETAMEGQRQPEEKLQSGFPDYKKLKCPKCGNTTSFVEFAMRETKQPFTVDPEKDEPDWEVFDFIDDSPYPEEVVCGKCFEEELVTVWKAVSEGEEMTTKQDRYMDSTQGGAPTEKSGVS